MENTDLLEQKIADIVALNIQTAHVFKKYGIDFCCGGGITIQKACEKKNIDMDLIIQDLKNIDEKVLQSQNYNNWELDFLTDFPSPCLTFLEGHESHHNLARLLFLYVL